MLIEDQEIFQEWYNTYPLKGCYFVLLLKKILHGYSKKVNIQTEYFLFGFVFRSMITLY